MVIDKTQANGYKATGAGYLCGVNNGRIEACYAQGDVETDENGSVGGLVGENQGTMLACYHIGAVKAPNARYVAGVVGLNKGTLWISYQADGVIMSDGKKGGVACIPADATEEQKAKIDYCFFDTSDAGADVKNAVEGIDNKENRLFGYTWYFMQTEEFVKYLNPGFDEWNKKNPDNKITLAAGFRPLPSDYPTLSRQLTSPADSGSSGESSGASDSSGSQEP